MPYKSRPISVYNPKDYLCGIGNWRPQWLQFMASPRVFLIIFSAMGIIQGANFTYMIASITTLEKRYAFDSKVSGLILIADNVIELITNPIFGYFATRLHRPRFIGFSIIVVVFSCYLAALPYFIYGHKEISRTHNSIVNSSYEFCDANRLDSSGKDSCVSNTIIPAVIIIWFASFLNGVGFTAYYVVGVPFLDDNVKKKNSPIYISTIAALRLLGPTLGFMLSSFFLRFYENPLIDPGITDIKDPQWIGAWWLGFVLLGTLILIFNIPMFFFPKYLKSSVNNPPYKSETVGVKDESDSKHELSNKFIPSFKRLIKNPIWICQTIGNTARLFGILGYMIFKSKYMESQFGKSASSANFFSGAIGVIPTSVGLFIGRILISILKPGPKILVTAVMLIEMFGHLGYFGAMFVGCPQPVTSGYMHNGLLQMESSCNNNCRCTLKTYKPVCASDGITNYFSPCFANCNNVTLYSKTGQPEEFSGCNCFGGIATFGNCEQNCNKFPVYITIFVISNFITSIARTGNTIINLRIIDKKDKSFAFGISGFFMNLFAFIPYPLVFGAVTDSACKVWETSCGQQGNCWIYDTDKFRYYLHGLAVFFLILGSVFDVIVVFLAGRIKDLYDDNVEQSLNLKKNTEMQSLTTDSEH